ncbi:glycosyltransferase [bacterium]|nr:glycosyltransferase [bacterium]
MKVSIITVCRNAENVIERTIFSVVTQSCFAENIEYLIIDGASTDKTIEIIKQYSDKYPIKWISEPDSGIYNAMNKALKIANGEIIYFLNAGDRLFDEKTIELVLNEFEKCDADFLYTNVLSCNSKDLTDAKIKKYNNVDKYFLIRDCICHQASFYKKSVFDRLGGFNEGFKLAADYEMLLKIMADKNLKNEYLPIVTAYYDNTGVSSLNTKDLQEEREKIIKTNFSTFERITLKSKTYRFYRKFGAAIKFFIDQYRGTND